MLPLHNAAPFAFCIALGAVLSSIIKGLVRRIHRRRINREYAKLEAYAESIAQLEQDDRRQDTDGVCQE